MIYFLYGPDTYRSRKKLRDIIAEFEKKAGGTMSLSRLDASDHPEAMFSTGRTASLFAAKELVVIENVLGAKEEILEYVGGNLPRWREDRDLTVIFWEGEVAKSEKMAAELKRHAVKSQEFLRLGPAALARWLNAEGTSRSLELTPQERRILEERYGSDLWAISQELEKMRDGWSVAGAAEAEEKIWNFTDAFLEHRRLSFRPLMNLLSSGYESVYLVGALASAVRALALTWQGLATNRLKKMTAALSPYVVRKNTELARSVSRDAIRSKFQALSDADQELKTGKLPSPLPLLKLILKK